MELMTFEYKIKLGPSVGSVLVSINSLMPYPCSHFYFDIKFGDRLYSKEKR